MKRRLLTAALALGLVFGGMGSAEAKPPARTERTVNASYAAYPAPVTGCNEPLGSWACMAVQARPAERFVTVKVTDAHGLPVYFYLSAYLSSHQPESTRGFCGKTKTPVAIPAGSHLEIEVGVSRAVAQTDCPASSVKTTGTIKVTLSNQP